jgi:hypothetical protein
MSTSKRAGKASGVRRADLARLRRYRVLSAFERLKPAYQNQPYSLESIEALENELHNPKVHDPLPQLEPPLSDYESVVNPSRRAPSERLMRRLINTSDIQKPPSIRRVSRETLIKDLKALGIKSKRRKKRSG